MYKVLDTEDLNHETTDYSIKNQPLAFQRKDNDNKFLAAGCKEHLSFLFSCWNPKDN